MLMSSIVAQCFVKQVRNKAGNPAQTNCKTRAPYSTSCKWQRTPDFPTGQCVAKDVAASLGAGAGDAAAARQSDADDTVPMEENPLLMAAFGILLVAVVVGPLLVMATFRKNGPENGSGSFAGRTPAGSFYSGMSQSSAPSTRAGSKLSLNPSIRSALTDASAARTTPDLEIHDAGSDIEAEWDNTVDTTFSRPPQFLHPLDVAAKPRPRLATNSSSQSRTRPMSMALDADPDASVAV